MIKSQHIEADLPQLDRSGDPRGGAIAWALLTVAAVAITVMTVAII